jgi:hypothetical protein
VTVDSQVVEPVALSSTPAGARKPTLWPDGLFFGALAVICGLAVFIGLAPIVMFGHDIFFFLDNSYRVLQGQVPHRDFESAWGPLIYLINAVGLRLSGLRPDGIGYANAIFGALIATWAYRIARRRMSPVAACGMGIYTLLLIVAPFSLGFGALNFSHAMVYNRYGFALLGIIILECQPASGNPEGGRSTGVAIGLLAFLKITFAMVAVPLLLVIGGASLFRKRRLVAVCSGGAIVAALLLLYLRFDLADMLHDLMMAASGRSRSWDPHTILLRGFPLTEGVPLLLLAWMSATSRLRWFGVAIAILALQGFLLSTNQQPNTLPLNGFLAVVLADRYFRHSTKRAATVEAVLVGFLTFVCVAPLTFQNVRSLVAAARAKLQPPPTEVVRLTADRGASILFQHGPYLTETGGPEYVRAVNDGIALLRRHTGPRDGVLTIDMTNPFNYLLDRPSPTGGLAAGAYNYVISDQAHPSADRWAGNARYLLLRKYAGCMEDSPGEKYHVEGVRKIYRSRLDQQFQLVEETDHWILYGKR